MFDTVHNFVLNYDSITIEPKSSASSDMSTISGGAGNTSDTNSEDSSQWYENGKTGITLSGVKFKTNNKQALSYAQVNAMTFLQAREEATRTDKYYWTTILRLRARAALYNVGPGTPYYKFNY